MPEIAVTADQRERLRWIQRRLAEDVTYGHVRPCDALAYLFDQAEASGALAEIRAERAEPVEADDLPPSSGRVDNGADVTESATETPTEARAEPESAETGTLNSGGLSHTVHTSSSANTVRIATPSLNTNGMEDDTADAEVVDNSDDGPDDGDESETADDTDADGTQEETVADTDDTDAADTDDTDDTDAADTDEETADESDTDEHDAADGGDEGAATLHSMMNLLDAHADKWREADGGEAKYEVDLPDGSVEGARTKDDVKAVLFKQYR